MKIYFEDGPIKEKEFCGVDYLYSIDAANGYSFCRNVLNHAKKSYPNCTIYTNSIIALNNDYCWNDVDHVCELYLRDIITGKFVRADMLTDKELRKFHNLMHLYINNGFKKFIEGNYEVI